MSGFTLSVIASYPCLAAACARARNSEVSDNGRQSTSRQAKTDTVLVRKSPCASLVLVRRDVIIGGGAR